MSADIAPLFLRDIANMDLTVQSYLLGALETGWIKQAGLNAQHVVDVRIISGTSSLETLKMRVAAKEFREDLFFRLNVLRLHISSEHQPT
jgi:two-component system nitrogen regulation response regulator GlnG